MGENNTENRENENLPENDISESSGNAQSSAPRKNKGEELLEKLRSHNNGDRTANPDILTRRDSEEPPIGTPRTRKGESLISQMRKNSRAIDDAEKNADGVDLGIEGDGDTRGRALVSLGSTSPTVDDDDTGLVSDTDEGGGSDRPKDDGYDIRTVFGISDEHDDEKEETEEEESVVSTDKENFVASKEFEKLKAEFFACIPKLALCVILAFGTFFYENFELLGIKNSVFIKISSDVRISALAGIQVTLFAVAIMLKEMWYGLKNLLRLRPQPESFLPFLALFLLIYQFASLFAGYGDFVPFNFVLFTASIFCLVSKWSDLSRRLHTLKIVSSKSVKYALVKMKKSESAPEREATSGIMDLAEDAKYIRVVRAKKITGCKARTDGRMIYKSLSGVFIVAALIAAAVTFVITSKAYSFAESLRAAFSVVMFVTPLSLYTVFSFPLYKVSKRALKTGTAVIGDAASLEYSAPAFVTFSDTDVFTDSNVWLDEVAMKDSDSFSKGLAYASVIFKPISGPLNRLFAGAADYDVTNEGVEYIDISDDGLEAVVNRERVRVGQASYFTKYGYMLDDESKGNYRIMYVEIGNVISLKVKIVYNIDKDFEKILQNLYKSGMGVVIRTSDPNINVNMIESIIGTGRFPIKVLKYKTESEKDVAYESVDGGIVSKGRVRPMLETIYRCDRAGAVIKSGLLLEVIAFVLGIIAVTVLGGLGALEGLTSIYLALYHIFWSALVFLLTFIFV